MVDHQQCRAILGDKIKAVDLVVVVATHGRQHLLPAFHPAFWDDLILFHAAAFSTAIKVKPELETDRRQHIHM